MKTIQFNKKKVAYSSSGKGMPLVLVHGFCEDSNMWDDFAVRLFSYRVIRIDLPGFGESEVVNGVSITYFAEAISAVLTHLKLKKYIYVGHSMGGYVGLELAKIDQDRMNGLVLFHSHPFADSEEKKAARNKGIEFIEKNGVIHYVKQIIPSLFAYDYKKGYPFEVNKLLYHASQLKAEGVVAALKAMRDRNDNAENLKNIHCPVQFFIGKEDQTIPMEASMEQIHLPPIADIHILNGVGHMAMFEAKRSVLKYLNDFIQNIVA